MDFLDIPTRFTFTGEVVDVLSFVNNISQGDNSKFVDDSSCLVSTNILPYILEGPIVLMASTVSFWDDAVGNVIDNAFGTVLEINLRDRGKIKIPSRFQSSPSNPSSFNSTVLDRLLRIKLDEIGVTICGGKFGKTGLYTYSSSVYFPSSYGIKSHGIKDQPFFEGLMYICTPSKTN